MNIDIVNKQVSKKLNIDEKKVALVNKFYWRKVYDHFYSYDERPVNIEFVCVFFTDERIIKKGIVHYISKIRRTLKSKRFKEGSTMRIGYLESYKKVFRNIWRIRKINKYTN